MAITYQNHNVYISLTIDNGQSLSNAIDLGEFRLCAIFMPAAWTAADLTVQVSADNVTFSNLHKSDAAGASAEYLIDADANRTILVPVEDFAALQYLKIRSGTSSTPTNQAASRTLFLIARSW